MYVSGASIGFYSGDLRRLTDDIIAVSPTVFAGVPRVFLRMYDKIWQGMFSVFVCASFIGRIGRSPFCDCVKMSHVSIEIC